MTSFTRFIVLTWWFCLTLSGLLQWLSVVVHLALGSRLFSTLAGFVALLGISAALFGWLMVAISPQMPARVAVPLLMAQSWYFLGVMPFALLAFGGPWFEVLTGGVLLLGVAGSVLAALTLGTTSHAYNQVIEARPMYRPIRSVAWVGGSFTIVPTLAVIYLVANTAWAISYSTNDFVRLNVHGVSFAHKTYVQDDRTVHLIAMVHIGEPDAYDTLFGPFRGLQDAVVLSEGVSDKDGLLVNSGGGYDDVAENLGLSVQGNMDDLTSLPNQNADVDVNTFHPHTLELLGIIFQVYGSENPETAAKNYLSFWSSHSSDTQEVLDQLMSDILLSRNNHLLGEIDAATASHVVVPWGALHMAEVGPGLEERGWTNQNTERVELIRWSTLLGAL
ncbi:MAG: hypothetical protein GWP91_09010 [Rhodobacterales bacterium]|nr:hypothetical protein [Rhodobacterales bacterium]